MNLRKHGCLPCSTAADLAKFNYEEALAVANRTKKEGPMIYGSFNSSKTPKNVVRHFPKTGVFGYELVQLRLRVVCDTTQDRDSMYAQAKDAHQHVAAVGPRQTEDKKWYGIYW
jgi:hypothetical protein